LFAKQFSKKQQQQQRDGEDKTNDNNISESISAFKSLSIIENNKSDDSSKVNLQHRFNDGLSFPIVKQIDHNEIDEPILNLNDNNSNNSVDSNNNNNDMNGLLQQADKESDAILSSMNNNEIDEALKEIESKLSPSIIEMLKNRKQKRKVCFFFVFLNKVNLMYLLFSLFLFVIFIVETK
jgi:hypothetical protein